MDEIVSMDDQALEAYWQRRASRALALTLGWMTRQLAECKANPTIDAPTGWIERRLVLARAVLEGVQPGPLSLDAEEGRPWERWVSLKAVEARAQLEGPESLSARWLLSLPLGDAARQHHEYAQATLWRAINAAWILSGVYFCEPSDKADQCEALALSFAGEAEDRWLNDEELESLRSSLKASMEKESLREALAAPGVKAGRLRV